MSVFQLIVTSIFVAFIIIGVGVFALFGGLGGGAGVGPVLVWGTLPQESIDTMLLNLRTEDKVLQEVTYIEKGEATYAQELVAAMAAGTGPDLFVVAHEDMLSFSDKVLTIPYSMVSQGSFTTTFIDEGQLFLVADGSLALPLTVDPLVMYWNRDLFASAGVAAAPRYWNDFLTLAPKITSHNTTSQVSRSAVALGEWRNIANAKAILSSLIMQAGDPIVARGEQGLVSMLGILPDGASEAPAHSALRFYTEFANPSKAVYSWNRSLPEAQDAFVAGDAAVYFGFASEYARVRERNPNLNIGVELLPQIQGNTANLTFGNLSGLAVSRSAQNPQGAAQVAQRLTGEVAVAYLSQILGLPPVRRDVSVDTQSNAALGVFARSALIARGWLDPSPTETAVLFQSMIESVASGRATPPEAVSDASQLLYELLQ